MLFSGPAAKTTLCRGTKKSGVRSKGSKEACQVRRVENKTEFSHRIAPDRMPDIGGLIFVCQDGEYDWWPVLYPFKKREPWVDESDQ